MRTRRTLVFFNSKAERLHHMYTNLNARDQDIIFVGRLVGFAQRKCLTCRSYPRSQAGASDLKTNPKLDFFLNANVAKRHQTSPNVRYMTEIANGCPLGDYGTASQVAHLTATSPLGSVLTALLSFLQAMKPIQFAALCIYIYIYIYLYSLNGGFPWVLPSAQRQRSHLILVVTSLVPR
jgi:hypothetical protein